MLRKFIKLLELNLEILSEKAIRLHEQNLKWSSVEKYHLETGEKFNNLINNYPISEDELLDMSETICKFVELTRITNIDEYLFHDKELTHPRLKFELNRFKPRK